MTLIPDKIYGINAAKEVAYAKGKPIQNSSYRRRAGRTNQARKQIYATVFCSFAREDDSPCRPGAQQ
jgi:hypothetical protein